jgi:NADH-quinone oxidoreductase subunit N
MSTPEITTILPFIILAATSVVLMLTIAFHRDHRITMILTLAGFAAAAASLPALSLATSRAVAPLFIMDNYALFYQGLILFASFSVAALSYSYFNRHTGHREEFYLLLVLATLGAAVLCASTHFVSLFLGIELLSVSLYAMAAYLRHSDRSIEAGVKYLILAAVSSAFILFGMALVYAETGSLEFLRIASLAKASGVHDLTLAAGLGMIVTGLGFKLAVVPFHLWTPDVYEGAPAPVTAFIATASKGAVFALVMRYFFVLNIHAYPYLSIIFSLIAVASMFTGNLLALLQRNVKRILAYSSISHLGYLIVTLLASGPMASNAAAFYLAAYFVTTLGAFGVVSVLSGKERDADRMEDYTGLAWRSPWLAGVFTVMLLSLAGIPLTAGFVAKFYLVAAGVGSALWVLVLVLVINSAIGLFYYLRIIIAIYSRSDAESAAPTPSLSGSTVLAGLTITLIWLGVYPGPMLEMIKKAVQNLT